MLFVEMLFGFFLSCRFVEMLLHFLQAFLQPGVCSQNQFFKQTTAVDYKIILVFIIIVLHTLVDFCYEIIVNVSHESFI